jgi:hypothetical protein
MTLLQTAAEVWRKYVIAGVPASGANQPAKADIVAWGSFLESMLTGSAQGLAYATLSALNADLAHGANTTAIVYNDATAANNGLYVKAGTSGSGSWSRIGDLPNSIVRLTATGGTANAIVATATETPTVPGNKLYLLTPTANNTTDTTIAVNGAGAVQVKNALGSQLAANSLVADIPVLMAWQTDHYQILVSVPVDATGVLNDVIVARDAAAASATAAASSASALGNQVHQYDTRALAAAATIPVGVQAVKVTRYATGCPLSYATYIPGSSSGPGAFQEAGGHYWELDLSGNNEPLLLWLGAKGDDSTDNITAVQAAINALGWRGRLFLPPGSFYCATIPTNPKGVTFSGPGYLSSNDANGSRYRWDQRGNDYPQIEGLEYFGPYHHILRTQSIGAMTYEFIGDSTFAQEPETGFSVPKIIQSNMSFLGVGASTFNNRAISGVTTAQMRSVQAPLSIAANPDILFIHPGMNDVYIMSPTGGIRTDAQILAGAEIFRASLDGMLSDIRASFHHLRLTIVLMAPNTASLYTGGDDERYFETVSPMVRAIARKYRCVFFDTYRIWRDARDMGPAEGTYAWMDDTFSAGQGSQHPQADFNVQIADMLTEMLVPVSLRRLRSAPILSTPRAYAALPAASAAIAGARAFITDSNAVISSTNVGGAITAGGAFKVPVFCDGAAWRYG